MQVRRAGDPPRDTTRAEVSGPGTLAMPVASRAASGPTLRTARERLGLSLEDVASETKIAARHLLAIEESRFDGFSASIYALGFARNYARAVGVSLVWINDCLSDAVSEEFAHRVRSDIGWSSNPLQKPKRFRR